MSKKGWKFPEDRNSASDEWAKKTIESAQSADNFFYDDGLEYDPLIYCSKYNDEYKEYIDTAIKMDEEGKMVFKEEVKRMQSGGNRRRRISRRRRPLFSSLSHRTRDLSW